MKGRALGIFGLFGILAAAAAAAQGDSWARQRSRAAAGVRPEPLPPHVVRLHQSLRRAAHDSDPDRSRVPVAEPRIPGDADVQHAAEEPGHPTDENNPNYFPLVGDPAIGRLDVQRGGRSRAGLSPRRRQTASTPRRRYVRPDGAQIDFSGGPSSWVAKDDGSQYKLVVRTARRSQLHVHDVGYDGNRYDFARFVQGYDDEFRVAPGYARATSDTGATATS